MTKNKEPKCKICEDKGWYYGPADGHDEDSLCRCWAGFKERLSRIAYMLMS